MASKFEPIDLSESGRNEVYPSGVNQSEGLHLFVSHPRVEDLPECGTITFRFSRGPVTSVEEFGDQPEKASVDLCLCEIVSVKEDKSECDEKDESGDTLDDLYEKSAKE